MSKVDEEDEGDQGNNPGYDTETNAFALILNRIFIDLTIEFQRIQK